MKVIVVPEAEGPLRGKALCQRCKREADLSTLNSSHLCPTCQADIRARNAGKPRPSRQKAVKRNSFGWVEREESARPMDGGVAELIARAGSIVSETENIPHTNGMLPESSIVVSETDNEAAGTDICKPVSRGGSKVPETSIKVSETTLEWQNQMAQDLSYALRKIRELEDMVEKLSPLIEKEEERRDSDGMQRLRDRLFDLLRKSPSGGAYVSNLYGPHGQRGGRLGISKAQAFRLRDACRMDDRFQVMKAENQGGKWIIILNQKIK